MYVQLYSLVGISSEWGSVKYTTLKIRANPDFTHTHTHTHTHRAPVPYTTCTRMFFIGPFAIFVLACPCDAVPVGGSSTTVVRTGAPETDDECKA